MRVIAHISDLHFGRHDPRKVEALLRSIEDAKPDLVAVSGDLTQRARQVEFAEARQFLDRIGVPILVVPGNHDMPLYGIHRRLFDPMKKFNRYIAPAGLTDCFYADEEIAALGLNTTRRLTGKNGRVSVEQMAKIRGVFSRSPEHVWKLLVTHHPVASAEGDEDVALAGGATLALRSIATAGVHVLLSGHHHQPASGEVCAELVMNGLVLVVHAGTAVSTRTRGGELNSYNRIALDGARIGVTVMVWDDAHGFQPRESIPYAFDSREGALKPAT